MRLHKSAIATAASIATLAAGGGVAWACTDPGTTGTTGTTTPTTTTTATTGTTSTTTATTASVRRHSRRRHAARR